MTKDEALKLALEALENAEYGDYDKEELNKAITIIKEALAQPEQEPVGWFGYDQGTSIWFETNKGEDNSVPLYTTPSQPEQEHFALKHRIAELEGAVIGLQAQLAQTERPVDCERCNRLEEQAYDLVGKLRVANIKLSMQPQRTWVGLTADELQPIADEYRILFGSWVEDFARAIEAKLKEKNT